MQNIISNAEMPLLKEIIVEIGPNLSELMCDAFGNYFCQKIFSLIDYNWNLYDIHVILT